MEGEILEAEKKAMALLQHMDRTEWELRDKLAKKGFSPEAIEGAIEYVSSFHYIDDLRYARHFIEIYREQRSLQRLRQDLNKRHVPEECIDLALEEIDWDDTPALEREAAKLLRGTEKEQLSYQEKSKLAAKLYRRGFRSGDIRRVLDM